MSGKTITVIYLNNLIQCLETIRTLSIVKADQVTEVADAKSQQNSMEKMVRRLTENGRVPTRMLLQKRTLHVSVSEKLRSTLSK